jgi:aminomethyltransferase
MKKTRLFSVHERLGAKIVDFAGFKMPVQYTSIISEHKSVRASVGVFDVSHMGEIFINGKNALDFIQHITVNDASLLTNGRIQYSAMCYSDGGIVDDLLVYRFNEEKYMLVVNASNKDKDYQWMIENNHINADIIDESDDYSLLAVQGPNSKLVVEEMCGEAVDLEFYHFKFIKVDGIEIILSRTGYTGELGYELYFKGSETEAENIWNKLFEAGKNYNIQPIGLGARDSLRLEMGYCLYGNDIDQTTNTLEAGLGWITKLKKKEFMGRDSLIEIKRKGLTRKLVPLISVEKAFPRHGYDLSVEGVVVGKITSGTVSPVLEKAIALGFVESEFAKEGNKINFNIRGREIPAVITKLPFVKN